MARPRNPETDEIIRLLGAKMSVQAVAERLNITTDLIKDVYRRHYDEIVTLQRAAERREKAEELAHLMAQKSGQKAKKADEPTMKPVAAAPEPMKETATKKAVLKSTKEPDAELVKEAVAKKPTPEPEEAAGITKARAEGVSKGVECSAGTTNAHEDPAPDEADRPAGGRLRVCGYLGDCGRVYTINGRTIEIANLAPRFAKEDLRVLAHEILELVRILDKREGVSA